MNPKVISKIPRVLRQALKLVRNHGDEKERELASKYQVRLEQVIFELEESESIPAAEAVTTDEQR